MKQTIKRRFFRLALSLLALWMLVLPAAGAAVNYEAGTLTRKAETPKDPTPEAPAADDSGDDWEDWDDDDTPVDNSQISAEFTPHLVCDNQNYTLWYDTTGADIYVRDKRDGHIWSNTVDREYYADESASRSLLSQLLQVGICDEEGGISLFRLCDAVGDQNIFSLTPSYDGEGMTLNVTVKAAGVSFAVRFALTETGLSVSVPADRVVQENGSRLSSLQLMPCFGAARTDESGYLLLPDGSGALVEFDGRSQQEERVYSYSLYGAAEQDMDALLKRDDQDIKNMMLPVTGIRGKNSGFAVAVTTGAENATLNVVPYGYQAPLLGRAYYTLMYLYTESLEINGKELDQIMELQELSDRTLQYFLLPSSACDYSDMAAAYRGYLEQTGVLKNRLAERELPLSLDVFMGVEKSGLFLKGYASMTTFEQAKAILEDLTESGITHMEVTLQGWNDGGFTALPTAPSVSGKAGGNSGLKKLAAFCRDSNIPLYLYQNMLEADTDTKTANLRRDAVRDYVSNLVTDSRSKTVMLNVTKTLRERLTKARKAGLGQNTAFSLARAGQWLWNCYERGADSSRLDAVTAYQQALEECQKTEGRVQVYGGNQYVLPYAASLREIPDTHSGYYIETASVPFYQMVVSGYARYTSVAGNMTYDEKTRILRWVEYGAAPYFVLTEKNASELQGSEYDRLFTSEYSVWGDRIKEIYGDMRQRLAPLAGAAMIRHTRLSETLFRVDYDNGGCVYVNYGDTQVTVPGGTVPAGDYRVVPTAESEAAA